MLSQSPNRVLFRVDASSVMGVGHLMRCLALAQALDKQGAQCTFLVNEDAYQICQKRQDWVGEVEVIPHCDDLSLQLPWLVSRATEGQYQALVLDGYHFDEAYRSALQELDCLRVCFDDTNQLLNLHADLIINGASNADSLNYEDTAAGAVLCLGDQYRVLRDEFSDSQVVDFATRNCLTLTLGGSDPLNLTIPILYALHSRGFTGQIQVITGPAYAKLKALRHLLQRLDLRVIHSHDCQHIARRFLASRLVISAAGGSQFELQACGCPSMLLVVADNQYNATEQAASQGWCEMWDVRGTGQIDALVDSVMVLWHEQEELRAMSERAYQTCDNQGAQRVATAILSAVNKR